MTDYAIVKNGSTYYVVRDNTSFTASWTYSGSDSFIVYDWTANAAVASWTGTDAGPTVASFSTANNGNFGVFDATAQGQVAAWAGTDSGQPWPVPPPAGQLFKPTSAAQLQAAWQAAIAAGYILHLDPTTAITDSTPIVVPGVDFGQQPRGLNGNGASFNYTGTGAAVTLQPGPSNNNRGMALTNFHIQGNNTAGTTGLYFAVDSPVAFYKFTGRDIYVDGFGVGIRVEGNFFESLLDNMQVENCSGDGIQVADGPANTIAGIISNVTLLTPNLSRNGGYGLHLSTAKSVDVRGGSFINDVKGGIFAEQGERTIDGPNFENCGTAAITLSAAADAGCTVVNCSGSNTATFPGGPMTKLINYTGAAGGLYQAGNQMYAGTVT
jgi:hypothetical protein